MGKGKPRHNPDKPQNTVGGDYDCEFYDSYADGREFCHDHWNKWWKTEDGKLVCKGNPHTCLKMKHHYIASLSDKEKEKFFDLMEA